MAGSIAHETDLRITRGPLSGNVTFDRGEDRVGCLGPDERMFAAVPTPSMKSLILIVRSRTGLVFDGPEPGRAG